MINIQNTKKPNINLFYFYKYYTYTQIIKNVIVHFKQKKRRGFFFIILKSLVTYNQTHLKYYLMKQIYQYHRVKSKNIIILQPARTKLTVNK